MSQTTVLLVDGSGRSATWLRNHLEVEGFRVLVATDASSALDMAHSQSPTLVVLCTMALFADEPSRGGDGQQWLECGQFLECLRQESNVGVITLSHERGAAKSERSVGLRANEHLTWPFSRLRLLACIRAVLRQANPVGQEQG